MQITGQRRPANCVSFLMCDYLSMDVKTDKDEVFQRLTADDTTKQSLPKVSVILLVS